MVHGGGGCHRRWQERLHLVGAIPILLEPERKIHDVLVARPRGRAIVRFCTIPFDIGALVLLRLPDAASTRHIALLLDSDPSQPYIVAMTKLLDEAVEVVRRLPSNDQDDIARAIMQLAGSDLAAPVILSPEEREAIARSKAAADRGEFATDEQVQAVWAKHGL